MAKNKAKTPDISQHTTADEVSFNSVLLAINLEPVKVEDSKIELVPSQAKQLIKEYSLGKNSEKEVRAVYTSTTGVSYSLPQDMIPAIGSTEDIYSLGNCGLFSAVLTAYNNHWKLRTSPDDWWFSVIRRVACEIDKNTTKEAVRKMFVEHEGKKAIEVEVPDRSIYTVDYSWFFDQIAKGIQENVKVPEFVDGMTADFSTTTAVQKIVSQITLMYSVQEYFIYRMRMGCGIPAMEMLGTEDDWKKLKSKLKVLRTLLEPIESELGLESEWWGVVEEVFRKLLATYQGKPDRKWWSHVLSYENANASGMIIEGEYLYRGWITEFLEGRKDSMEVSQMTSGLVSLPLELVKPDYVGDVKDTAKLVAGMPGFTIHTSENSADVSVQPFQGWALLLSKNSPFRE